MGMTPEQKIRAKQSMQDESNLSWDDVTQRWVNGAKGVVDAINPNTNKVLDQGAAQQQYPTDPATMSKVKAMLGVNPQSMEEHRINELKRQANEAQGAAAGQQLMDQMAQPGADEGFETTAQREARFNKTKALMGR